MEILLLLIYSAFAWLVFFKFKWLPWNIVSQVVTVTLPIIGIAVLFLFLNISAPSTNDVRVMNYVVPIVPRVTGQVTEVPIEPNAPLKKGDVLFKIDPIPFEAAVKAAEATLVQTQVDLVSAEANERVLKDELENAKANKKALLPRIELAQKRSDQFAALVETGAGRRADLEQAQSELANLQSELDAAAAMESEAGAKLSARTASGEFAQIALAKAKIAQAGADLANARYDLEGTTHLAPANGRVTHLALRPGVRAAQLPMSPVMSFIEDADQWVLAFYRQNELRYVESGDEAEIYLKTHPGRIIKCKVDSILWATAQGQLPISGNLPYTAPTTMPEQRIAVRLLVGPKDKDLFLAAGARGSGAIFTHHHRPIQILQKVIVRVMAKLDWFVIKHLGGGGH